MEILAARVLLRPADFEASLRFYEEMLGLHRFREFGRAPARGVVFFLGGAYLELTESGLHNLPSGVRLWLQVRDVDVEVAALQRAGVPVSQPPETKPWELREATIHDPDGLPLILVEIPDDHPMRRDTRSR